MKPQPANKQMLLKILLVSGSGTDTGVPQVTEDILLKLFEPTVIDAYITTVTTKNAAENKLDMEDFDLVILSSNIRQTFELATDAPGGLDLVKRIRKDVLHPNFYAPIILTSGDVRSIERYADPENGIYVTATNVFANREAAANSLGAAMGMPHIARVLMYSAQKIQPHSETIYRRHTL